MPLLICRLSANVNKFLRFQTLDALFGPAEVMVPLAVVVTPPPSTIAPGPRPVTNGPAAGSNVACGEESLVKPAREKPAIKLLRMRGEKTCVSCRLMA